MMKTTILTSATALLMLSGAAVAEPTVMSDDQMDVIVAGNAFTILNPAGKPVWEVTDFANLEGFNNGGKGRTDKAGPGFVRGPVGKGVFTTE